MIKQKDIYPAYWCVGSPKEPERFFVELKTIEKLREQLKKKLDASKVAYDFQRGKIFNIIDEVFGVEAKE